eukprot:GHVP01040931.1.p1 GENE.GHVP01040931.1~~GHVP01040931.1.p1  ORF type:complete len:254 (-),score=6.79 GHVP01040931.1:639-1400(-)
MHIPYDFRIIHTVIHLLNITGLPINQEKSSLHPTQEKTVLGYPWKPNSLSAPTSKIDKLIRIYQMYNESKDPHLIQGGSFTRIHKALNKDNVQERKLHALINSDLKKNCISHNPQDAPWSLYVDASDSGIGTQIYDHENKLRAEHSTPNLLHLPINELEFKAVYQGLTKNLQLLKQNNIKNLRIFTDNIVVQRPLSGEASKMAVTSILYKQRIEGLFGHLRITPSFLSNQPTSTLGSRSVSYKNYDAKRKNPT